MVVIIYQVVDMEDLLEVDLEDQVEEEIMVLLQLVVTDKLEMVIHLP